MRIAVADDLQVDVISGPAAGEHGVQLLAGLLPRGEAVHRVSRHALGGMDGAGVAETGRGLDVVGGESDGEPAAVVPDSQLTVPTDMGDGPAIAVLNPVGGGQPESSVVSAGDDHISEARRISVGQRHLRSGRGVIKTMRPGTGG